MNGKRQDDERINGNIFGFTCNNSTLMVLVDNNGVSNKTFHHSLLLAVNTGSHRIHGTIYTVKPVYQDT